MIEKPKLWLYLNQIIERPDNSEILSQIASAIPEMFDYIKRVSTKHKLVIRRQRSVCNQAAILVRYTDQLYLEWRYNSVPVLARSLILLLQLLQQLNSLLPATCQKIMLPKVLMDKSRRKYRSCGHRLKLSLAAQGVSAELIGLALLPLEQLMSCERIAYKRFEYTVQHLRVLSIFEFAGECSGAAFVCWVFAESGVKNPRSGWSPDLFPASRVIWQRTRASAGSHAAVPRAGDVFGIWYPDKGRIAHVGFVDKWDGKWMTSVEGNTNEAGSAEGDGVYRKRRLTVSLYKVTDFIKDKRI